MLLLLGAIGAYPGMTSSMCAAAQFIPLSASVSSFPGASHPYTLAQNGNDVHRTLKTSSSKLSVKIADCHRAELIRCAVAVSMMSSH